MICMPVVSGSNATAYLRRAAGWPIMTTLG
jgi:hypothetical protein